MPDLVGQLWGWRGGGSPSAAWESNHFAVGARNFMMPQRLDTGTLSHFIGRNRQLPVARMLHAAATGVDCSGRRAVGVILGVLGLLLVVVVVLVIWWVWYYNPPMSF